MDMLLMVCVHAYGDLRLMSGPLYPPPVLILFPVPIIKYPRESKVEKCLFYLVYFGGLFQVSVHLYRKIEMAGT